MYAASAVFKRDLSRARTVLLCARDSHTSAILCDSVNPKSNNEAIIKRIKEDRYFAATVLFHLSPFSLGNVDEVKFLRACETPTLRKKKHSTILFFLIERKHHEEDFDG